MSKLWGEKEFLEESTVPAIFIYREGDWAVIAGVNENRVELLHVCVQETQSGWLSDLWMPGGDKCEYCGKTVDKAARALYKLLSI